MADLKNLEVWFLTGSQHLYGPATLNLVNEHANAISDSLNRESKIPVRLICKAVATTADEILNIIMEANHHKTCIGLIGWMHTFSPAKMWINGLKILQKPILHLHTQFNRDIPWSTIDMDFMNLNQSAHGDREFGFIMSRMRLNRKVVAGFWKDNRVVGDIADWTRAAAGWSDWQGAKFVRFGDNMRQVAVTEGDKVEAEIKFGFSVNGHGVGDLVAYIDCVSDPEINKLIEEYETSYLLAQELRKGEDRHYALRDAAKI
jgi:L-arabinose isomerase